MLRLTYRLYRLASWAWYWMPRRFTPAGLLALAALLASGLIGIDMEGTVAFQGFALVACLLGISFGGAWFFRGRFVVQRMLPRFSTIGQPLVYRVSVRNGTGKLFHDLELLEDLEDSRPTLEEFIARHESGAGPRSFRLEAMPLPFVTHGQARIRAVSLPALPPKGEVDVSVELLPLKRGPLRFTGATLAQPGP